MALSPNYSWAEPDNSSLVKNGASDIRALGDAIDASVWNIGFGQAGKNRIINGDFSINQRNFTSTTTSATFGFDRWLFTCSDGTVTYSSQSFTAGAAPVAGYESDRFARIVTTGQTTTTALGELLQKIEDVRTFAGQTATVSFWAKSASGTPKIAVEAVQDFGSGGSPSASVFTVVGSATINSTWTRYSITVAIPSISGKTVGTTANTSNLVIRLFVSAGTAYNSRTGSLGIQTNTFDIWGVQVEYGSKATPFETATGNPASELAACQRYYYRQTATSAYSYFSGMWTAATTSVIDFGIQFPVTMRTTHTSFEYSTLLISNQVSIYAASGTFTGKSESTPQWGVIRYTHGSGVFTQYLPYLLQANNSTSAYLAFNAEL
jgi:hypothetical protein